MGNNEGAILCNICRFRFGTCYYEFCFVSRWYVGLPSPSLSPILNSLLPLGTRIKKIQSTDLFGQNTTYTTISIPVWLHVSVPSWTILRPTFICEKYYQCALYIMRSIPYCLQNVPEKKFKLFLKLKYYGVSKMVCRCLHSVKKVLSLYSNSE